MGQPHRKKAPTGPARAEITFTSRKSGRMLHINSVETLPNSSTPTRRERETARRLVWNGRPGDIVVLNPKPARLEDVKWDAFELFMNPLLAELDKPAPSGGRQETGMEFPWYEWVPPR